MEVHRLVLEFKFNAFTTAPHLLLRDKESFVKKKKVFGFYIHSLKEMFYVPKIREKLLGYISEAFSRFSFFFSVQEMWCPSEGKLCWWWCQPGVNFHASSQLSVWVCSCTHADRALPPLASQRARTAQASEYSSCKAWLSLFVPASSPYFLCLSALIYL